MNLWSGLGVHAVRLALLSQNGANPKSMRTARRYAAAATPTGT